MTHYHIMLTVLVLALSVHDELLSHCTGIGVCTLIIGHILSAANLTAVPLRFLCVVVLGFYEAGLAVLVKSEFVCKLL